MKAINENENICLFVIIYILYLSVDALGDVLSSPFF